MLKIRRGSEKIDKKGEMRMKKLFIILLSASACLSLTAHDRVAVKLYGETAKKEQKTNNHYVTIWVHGLKLFGKNKSGLGLYHSSEFIRRNSLARVMRALKTSYTDQFSVDHVYGFVWSAEFSLKGRDKAAKDLNAALEKLSHQFHFGSAGAPKLRLIGFSEGANVVLSLAKQKHDSVYVVDELVLLAGPVQYSTAYLVHDQLFQRVFNMYSTGDYVQLISPQAIYDLDFTNPILTTRRFADAPNLIQATMRTNGHTMGHFGFNSPKFVVMINPVIELMNQWIDEKQTKKTDKYYIVTVYPDEQMTVLQKCNPRNHRKS